MLTINAIDLISRRSLAPTARRRGGLTVARTA